MKRTYIYIILLVFVFFPYNVVKADSRPDYSKYLDSCVADKTCLLLCAYSNKIDRSTVSYANNYEYALSYIYYKFNNPNRFIKWTEFVSSNEFLTLNIKWNERLASHKNVFWQSGVIDKLFDEGLCPLNSFIDTGKALGANEICFDNNKKYCTVDDPGGIGTTFNATSTKHYDYKTHIIRYFENYSINDKKEFTYRDCINLQNGNLNVVEKIKDDFKSSFLYNNNIPDFIEKSSFFKDGLIKAEKNVGDLKQFCDAEVEKAFEEGNITEAERDELLEKNNEGLEQEINQLEEYKNSIGKIVIGEGKPISCEDFEDEDGNNIIKEIWTIVMIITPILVILLGSLDFAKATFASDEEAIKKAQVNFMRRILAAIILFLLPIIISLMIDLADRSGVPVPDPIFCIFKK